MTILLPAQDASRRRIFPTTIPRTPNPAGLGGLVLASASGGCRVAALVDVGTGKLRWRRDLGRRWSHTANDADL